MRVLIIGGTGLISTGITRQLLTKGGFEIYHYNRGKREEAFNGAVHTIIGDRYDHAAFEAQIAELPTFDCVIDMIGYAVADVESLLRAFGGKCGHLIFCSTVDVYSRPASTYPVKESEPFRPTEWDYAQKKAQCEWLLWNWYAETRNPFTVLRPVHTYGAGGASLHTFGGASYHLDRLKKGRPIIVHGDGTSLWSSVHRDDCALAFVNAIGNAKTFGKSYHLPGDECVTWNQYHEIIAEAIGAPKPEIVHIPIDLLYKMDKRAYISWINFAYNNSFDPAAAKADLGYKYTVTIADGMRAIYENLVAQGKLQNSDDVPQDDQIIAAWRTLSAALPMV